MRRDRGRGRRVNMRHDNDTQIFRHRRRSRHGRARAHDAGFRAALGYAAGKVLSRPRRAATPGGADRQGHAHLRLHARVGARGGLLGRRRRRALCGPDADARGRLPHARAAPFGRRGDQRLAQSLSRTTASSSSPATASSCPTPIESGDRGGAGAADGAATTSAQLGKARARATTRTAATSSSARAPSRSELDLRGMKIVVDCAHGAAYNVAPHVFHELGAEVIAIGSQARRLQHQRRLRRHRTRRRWQGRGRARRRDFGIAFDGDGDRLADGRSRRPLLRRRPAALRDGEAPPPRRAAAAAAWSAR